MKTKDKKELSLKTLGELKVLASQVKDSLSELKLSKSQNKLKNTRQIFLKRKTLARILTFMKEKELLEGSKD